MNSTSPSSRLVRIAARSPARSSAGPLVTRSATSISAATIPARLVLPVPGRTREQQVVDGLAALARRAEQDVEVLLQPRLADELGEPARPQRRLLRRLHRIRARRAAALLSCVHRRRSTAEALERGAQEVLDRAVVGQVARARRAPRRARSRAR